MIERDPRIEKRFSAVAASRTFGHIRDAFHMDTKSVVDIGCSYGEFLAHCGPSSVGVTLTPAEATYGRTRGLTILEGNIEDTVFASSITSTFDIVFANNIFEHLYAPHTFLIEVKKLLKKEGVLILGVPSIPKISTLMRLRKFQGSLSGAHINFFTRDTLRLTVERAGWIVDDIRGFHWAPRAIDHLFDAVYPHFYVIARPQPSFAYSEKRKKELAGYH